MAKVTSTVIVHRPDRVLYYLPEITEEVNRYIAEGAEEYKQVLSLRDLGCEVVQGYFYSKPIPIAEFEVRYL